MRCPKCGSFIEDGKNVCFMCGANVNNEDGFSSPGQTNYSDDGTFGSAANMQNRDFNPSLNEEYYQKKEAYNNRMNDYKNASYDAASVNSKKDIFDFLSENKTIVTIVLVILLVIVVGFVGVKVYQFKTADPKLEPVMKDLYYKVDDYFKNVSSNSNQEIFAQSGNKGNSCSITITYGTSTSGDHVQDYYKAIRDNKGKELYDSDLNIIDKLNVPLYQEHNIIINDNTWYYLNEFYRPTEAGDYNILKYRYLSSMFKGFYYDITLINNDNDSTCNLALDKFVKTLEFIDPEENER